jgi:ATP-dependent helicase HrpB
MRYSPSSGFPVVETVRISQASAAQRAGRAGRTAPGTVYHLWSELDQRSMAEFTTPEIAECDFAAAMVDILLWGTPWQELPWFEAPPQAMINDALKLLTNLNIINDEGKITPSGKKTAALPLHPRLGSMLLYAAENDLLDLGLDIAAIVDDNNRSNRINEDSCDIIDEIIRFRRNPKKYPDRMQSRRQSAEIFHRKDAIRSNSDADVEAAGILLAVAFPEWVGKSRGKSDTVYKLSGGGAAELKVEDPLRNSEFIAVARLDCIKGANGRIRIAASLSGEDVEKIFSANIRETVKTEFDPDSGRVSAVKEKRLGEIILSSAPVAVAAEETAAAVLNAAISRNIAVPPKKNDAGCRLVERMYFAERKGNINFQAADIEDIIKRCVINSGKVRSFADLEKIDWSNAIRHEAGYHLIAELDRIAPAVFKTDRGKEIKIDYSGDSPSAAIRIQELYGCDHHPTVANTPLRLELLSPAMRPVQTTSDLPGFWRGSWSIVRKEMRARYPKHDWPEHPESASPPAPRKIKI